MSSNQSNSGYGLHFWVALLLALLLLAMWFMGYGPGGSKCVPAAALSTVTTPAITEPASALPTPAPAVATVAAAPVAAPVAAAVMQAVTSVPAAKVYFALDKTGVPADTDKTLGEVVAYLKANSTAKASVSGFHDPSGSKQHNEDLAKNRAIGVQAALDKLGIGSDRVILQKPVETTGSGKPADARRVEVSIVQP
jgi:K(+)-stimulated pyrophosphate-energized sodium pump